MDYIRYQEAESLIKLYPTLKAMLKSLQLNVESLRKEKALDDAIYSVNVRHEITDMPSFFTGTTSDKTGDIAIRISERLSADANRLEKDILKLSSVIERLDIGLNSLSRLQRLILEAYYWTEEHVTWKQIIESLKEHKYYLSRNQALNERQKGIVKIINVSKLTLVDYSWVLELLYGNSE